MTVYRLELTVTDLEVDPLPQMPLWDDCDLTAMTGSFHEWMLYQLTHEQRQAVRWHLTPLEENP